MATLAEIRAKLKEAENRGTDNNRTGGDNSIYPFWNIKEGGESVLRFLPDGNENNTFFWVERAMIKLPFAGIKGEAETKSTIVQVPCMEMYGESCPILNEVRGWFKDPALEEMGRKYWKKRSYVFQGFVTEDGLGEKETPENPIRRFIIGPQIFKLIQSALLDPELEDPLPLEPLPVPEPLPFPEVFVPPLVLEPVPELLLLLELEFSVPPFPPLEELLLVDVLLLLVVLD